MPEFILCPLVGRRRWFWRWCSHEWEYDAEESAGPYSGYIERCRKCRTLRQIVQ